MEYSNKQSPGDPIFWRLCDETHCHCDFRMTMTHCLEYDGLYIVNMIDIIWSALATVGALWILFDHVYLKKLPIFDFSGKIPRPKPIEIRIINASILITDIGRNAILRAVLFEIPWQFGMTALSCYFFGVCHTLANSSRHLYNSWVGSQSAVDIVGFVVISLPIIVINIVSIVAGYYAQIGDVDNATKWTEAIYYSWGAFDFIIGSMILISGLRLLRLLKGHLLTQGNLRENIIKIKLGATKVKIIIVIGCACLWGYCVVITLYASSRYYIMLDTPYTIVITSITLFNGPLATCIIEFAIILNIKLLNGISNLSLGSIDEFSSDNTAYTSQQQHQKETFNTNISMDDHHRHSFSFSNRLRGENLWSRRDTLACQQQQDNDDDEHYRTNNNSNKKSSLDHLSSPSSTYSFHHQHEEDDGSFIHLQSVQQHHQDSGKKSNESSIEEDQRHYNAMTSQFRMPSH
ncbi:unnamed protein product [Cunninghamella echinulata]